MEFDNIKKQIVEATPEQQESIIQQLSGTESGKSYASSIAQSYWNENIKAHDKKFYDGIDAKLTDLGFQKQKGQKTSDFLVQIALRNKELAEELEVLRQDPDKTKKAMQDLIEKHKKEIEAQDLPEGHTLGWHSGVHQGDECRRAILGVIDDEARQVLTIASEPCGRI